MLTHTLHHPHNQACDKQGTNVHAAKPQSSAENGWAHGGKEKRAHTFIVGTQLSQQHYTTAKGKGEKINRGS